MEPASKLDHSMALAANGIIADLRYLRCYSPKIGVWVIANIAAKVNVGDKAAPMAGSEEFMDHLKVRTLLQYLSIKKPCIP